MDFCQNLLGKKVVLCYRCWPQVRFAGVVRGSAKNGSTHFEKALSYGRWMNKPRASALSQKLARLRNCMDTSGIYRSRVFSSVPVLLRKDACQEKARASSLAFALAARRTLGATEDRESHRGRLGSLASWRSCWRSSRGET